MLSLTLHNLLARKVRLLMSTLAIVLGVAFLAGVLTFSHGMQSTFDGIIKGSTSDALVRPVGAKSFDAGQGGINISTLSPADVAKLKALPQVSQANGGVDGFGLNILDTHDKLVGGQGAPTLAFNYTDTRNILGEQSLHLESGRWPTGPDEIVLDSAARKTAGYHLGDRVKLIAPFGNPRREATLVGTAEFNGGGTAGAILVLFSTEGAQRMFLNGADAFTSVSLNAKPGVSQKELVAAAKTVLPREFTAVTGDKVVKESQTAVGQFLNVISTFLLVFALIAIVVGGFIIVNTFSILVAQRVRELALLRALGAGRGQVVGSVLLEAFAMSVIACTIGLFAGWGLAIGLAKLFTSFGLKIGTSALVITLPTVVICFVVGVLVTMVASFVPALRASRVPPVAAMREDAVVKPRSLRRRTVIGTVFLIIGAGLAAIGIGGGPGNDAAWIGAGAFVWIITVAAISPVIGRPVLVACRALFARVFGTQGRLAGDNALRDPRRTGATASALMIGLALVSTISVLAASLNKSVDDLVDENFSSDFLIQSQSFQPFPASIGDAVEKTPGVGTVTRQQSVSAKVDGKDQWVTSNTPGFDTIYQLDMTSGRQEITGKEALLSTSAAQEYGVRVGDTIKVAFSTGKSDRLRVTGIFKGDGVNTGDVTIADGLIEKAGVQQRDSSISIDVEPGADLDTVHKALDKVVDPLPIVSVQDRAEFSKSIRGQIDQLLYLIYGLLALAILIAVIGIVNTLGLSVIERTREIGLLRAIGLSRAKLWQMITLESVVIAVLGSVLGMALGLVFGSLLRYALRSDITSAALPIGSLLVFLAIAVVVGVFAAVVPAIRAARMNVLNAISTE